MQKLNAQSPPNVMRIYSVESRLQQKYLTASIYKAAVFSTVWSSMIASSVQG